MKNLILPFFLCAFLFSSAQYHLDEMGVKGGAGYNLVTSSVLFNSGPSVHAGFFYSHYFCGKRHGYQVEAGFKGLRMAAEKNAIIFGDPAQGNNRFNIGYFGAGFYLKLRKNTFHRRSEAAVLAGPKLDLLTFWNYKNGTQSYQGGVDGFKMNTVIPGFHLSLWFRSPFMEKSLFIEPGFEYFFIPNLDYLGDKPRSLNAILKICFTFWEMRG